MNPFRKDHDQLFAAARTKPKPPAKNRCRTTPLDERLRITRGRKLGNAHYSHSVDGRELAVIDDVSAELIEQSGRNFTIDKADPRGRHFLTFRQMGRAYTAMMFLHSKGLGFNLFYTFTLRSVQLTTDEQVAEAIERHIEHLRHWLSDRGSEFHYIWVVERGRNRGLHFHLLMHLPPGTRLDGHGGFKKEVAQSIFTITGMYPRRPAKLPKPPKSAHPSTNPFAVADDVMEDDTMTVDFKRNRSVDEQWYRWRYLMKGIDPNEGMNIRGRPRYECIRIDRYLGLEHFSYQGRYDGLRLGISRTLGPEKRDMFEATHGMPRNALRFAKEPGDLYGPQYLDWSMTKPEPVKLLKSLDI